jgi:ABC-2 type transport system permease protein
MGFRVNFLARCASELLWLGLLVMFFDLIYRQTAQIGDWSFEQYLFFMGTGIILNALIDSLFLDNCTNFAELIRTGDLDFALLKPIDEQFLLSCQRVDWSTMPKLFVGGGLLAYSCRHAASEITAMQVANYVALLAAGLAVLYSLMLIMASSSVWIIRTHSLYEVWFYVTQFARYPAEIYQVNWAGRLLRFLLMFVLPVLLAINVPARYGAAKLNEPELAAYLVVAATVSLVVSRAFFRFALTRYRSASS